MPSPYRWLIAALLFLASALSFFDRQVLSVLAPKILAELKLSNSDYAQAVAAFTLAYSVMFTLGGRLIDHWGTKLGLGLSVLFWTIASLLHAVTQNATQLTAFRLLLGAGEGGCFPGAGRGVLEWFGKSERSLAMGIATTGGSAFGAVLAPPLIVMAEANFGWRGAFLTTGALGILWLLAWFTLFRLPATAPSQETSPRPWPIKSILARREVWGLVCTRFLLDPVFYVYMFWIPQYLSKERGASLAEIGALSWIPFLCLGVSSLLGGYLSDSLIRHGWPLGRTRKSILSAAAALTPVSILALYAPDARAAVMLLGVLMFAHGFWMTNYMTLIADLFPTSTVATVVGLSGTAGGLGGFLANLAVGRIVDAVSFTPVFLVCGILYPIGLVILLATIPNVEKLTQPS
jgi:ACS family hexuronate transporter-like MFS transporter